MRLLRARRAQCAKDRSAMRSRELTSLSLLSALFASASLLGACSSTIVGTGGDGGTPLGNDAAPSKSYRTDCFASSDYCSCTYGGSTGSSSTRCDSTSIHNAVCCGDVSWPDKNLSCTCRAFTCKKLNGTAAESCECDTNGSGNLDSCTDTVCCAYNDLSTCRCGSSISCDSFETQVTRCEPLVINCTGSSQARTSACSQ
jgi:hypothetical protein